MCEIDAERAQQYDVPDQTFDDGPEKYRTFTNWRFFMSDTKEMILMAALKLFARDGYEAVPVSAIADGAGERYRG